MADDKTATVNVPTELLKPIIEAKVVEALGGSKGLLENFVKAVLGRKTRNSGYQEVSFVEDACMSAIESAVKQAAIEWIAQHKEVLVEAVKRDMAKRTRSIATDLVNGFADASKSAYNLRVSMAVEKRD